MHAADKAGTYIPHFCYHKKLTIAANCRMCLVEVEKAPKPMPACATPVTQGMIVRTKSDKAIKAQQSVMEFLLINHPLDCPICDQGGECQLQDLAVGYGGSSLALRRRKARRVPQGRRPADLHGGDDPLHPLHALRALRPGSGRRDGARHDRTAASTAEITTFVGDTVDSELSGNMIDICPVGALTSKPFRYSARTWELSRRKSVSPHDSHRRQPDRPGQEQPVMRVVPLENEDVNECWIADRDRFSYEALNSAERLTQPMIKQGGQWQHGRLEDRARVRRPRPEAASRPSTVPQSIGALAQPAQHARRAAPAGQAGARPGQRQHRPPPAPRRLRRLRRPVGAGSAPRSHRCRSCSACWSSARSCARTIRCSRSACARRCARAALSAISLHALCRRRLGDADGQRRSLPAPSDWVARAGRRGRRRRRRARASRRRWRRRQPATRPRPSPRRCSAASARPSCSATPPRSIRRPRAAGAGATGSARRPAPGRLPDRSRQHRRRAAGRRAAAARAA